MANMRRMLLAGMLALPFLLATAATSAAQAPGCAAPGGGGVGAVGANFGYGYGAGTGGYQGPFCGLFLGVPPAGHFSAGFRIFPLIHQQGPLVNYGPFAGYYPFEPYGPWTSDLKYTGSLQAPPGHFARHGGGIGGAATGHIRLSELSGGGGGHTWGSYSLATLKNVGHRIHGPHHGGCSNCQSAIQPAEPIQAASSTLTER
jgi:hypothetical protein